jgi:quercetin dioxygenase-like cupin family protein
MSLKRVGEVKFSLLALSLLFFAPVIALAQDPVEVEDDIYKKIFENDRIRLVEVKMAAKAKTAMHSHPDALSVILEPSTVKWTMPDGESRQSGPEMKRASVFFMGGETHISENAGESPVRVILVEFKTPAPAAGTGRNPSLPAPYKQVADNPHARVFEITVAPGGTVPEHTHGENVIVALTDGTAEVTDKTGNKETLNFNKDTAVFGGSTTHAAVNTGKTPLQLIAIELK